MKSRYGFYKVASGLFYTHVADVKKNADEILALLDKAKKEKVQVLVFPELSLTGYTCQDLFLQSPLLDEAKKYLRDIAGRVPENMLVFVGLPLRVVNDVYNVAAVLSAGKVLAFIPKTHLPNNAEYYERRWFTSGDNLGVTEIDLGFGYPVPIGNDIIFSFGDLQVACDICEDLWVIKPPSDDAVLAGANLIVNLSASDETIAKRDYRRDLVRMKSAKDYSAYLYCSSGQGESTQDLVFSGHQLLYEEGRKIFESYDEAGLHIGLIDVEHLQNDRMRNKSSFTCPCGKSFRILSVCPQDELDFLPDYVDSHPFLVSGSARRMRSREILQLQAKGLMIRLKNINVHKVVIGVSGGLDSTLALLVCKEAFDRLGYPTKNIHAFSMPSKATSDNTFNNAKDLIEEIGCTYHEIPIEKTLYSHLKDIEHPEDLYDTTYENAQARIRTLILMDESNKLGGIVIGTADLSEACLGFSTYNGDHMSMYAVNISIPKTLVRALILDYAEDHPEFKKVLTAIVDTPISPELVPGKQGEIVQKTEEIIGSYDLHDFFIFHFLRNGFGKEKIFALAKIAFQKVSVETIQSTLEIFFKRFFTQQFKRSCLPDGVKVGSIAISPRGDLRMPSDLSSDNSFNPRMSKAKGK